MGVDSIFETGALVYLGGRGGWRRERGTRGKGMLNRPRAKYGDIELGCQHRGVGPCGEGTVVGFWVKCCKRSCEGQEEQEEGWPNNHSHVGSRSRPPRFSDDSKKFVTHFTLYRGKSCPSFLPLRCPYILKLAGQALCCRVYLCLTIRSACSLLPIQRMPPVGDKSDKGRFQAGVAIVSPLP